MLTCEPFPYQLEGARYAIKHNYCIIADQMGLGKSFQAIIVALVLGHRVCIIVPAFLKRNWAKEINKFSSTKIHFKMYADSKEKFEPEAHIHIINYEMLSLPIAEKILSTVMMVIADEFHYAKNLKSNRSKKLFELLKKYRIPRLIGLTGTPMVRMEDLYNLLLFLDLNPMSNSGPKTYLKWASFEDFGKYFCDVTVTPTYVKGGKKRFIKKFTGVKEDKLPELHKLLEHKMIRRLAEDVLELPDAIPNEVEVDYEIVEDDALLRDWEEYVITGSVSKAAASRKAESAMKKANFTAKYATNVLEQCDGPIVIFTDHLAPIPILVEGLRDAGYPCSVISGDVGTKARDEIEVMFKEGKIRALVATYGAAGVGLNLVESNRVILNDYPWTDDVLEQAKRRIRRIGQTKKCFYDFIIGSPVDRLVTANIDLTRTLADKVLNHKEIL